MDGDERLRLVEIMEAVAGGDHAAAFALVAEFGGPLRAAVRRAADRLGVRLAPEEVDEVLTDVVLALVDVAPSWRPDGGALPWVWAEKRILGVVGRHVGQHHDELPDDLAEHDASDRGPDGVLAHDGGVLEVLAGSGSEELVAARRLADLIGWEKAEVWLEYECQQAAGDPSPAETVAQMFGRRPDAVRQLVRRARRQARALVAEHEALAVLADSRLVA